MLHFTEIVLTAELLYWNALNCTGVHAILCSSNKYTLWHFVCPVSSVALQLLNVIVGKSKTSVLCWCPSQATVHNKSLKQCRHYVHLHGTFFSCWKCNWQRHVYFDIIGHVIFYEWKERRNRRKERQKFVVDLPPLAFRNRVDRKPLWHSTDDSHFDIPWK